MARGLRWVVDSPNESAQNCFAGKLGVSKVTGQILANRGIQNIPEAYDFMNPSLKKLHKPHLMPNMKKAAERIWKSFTLGEKVAIFGDYDCDGVTAASTLYHALAFFGHPPLLYVPHRLNEGYGMNEDAVRKLHEAGVKLIVSVDCGITAVGPARVVKELGMELIVTDHHEPKEELPDCYTIVHPRVFGEYPNPDLCGAGVAFKLAWALGQAATGDESVDKQYSQLLQELLCLTTIGTVADVVPLKGENRIIAKFGLNRMDECQLTGVRAMIVAAGLDGQTINGEAIGFCLAPRLNAAGRMGHAETALRMFCKCEWEEALTIAKSLESQNKERQKTERAITVAAKAQAEELRKRTPHSLVLVGEDWHNGVVGIVASRVIDDYYCPTIVLAKSGDELHGSARSIEGFNLAQGLKANEYLLTRWGGHAMAAGLKLDASKLEEFRIRLDQYVAAMCPPELLQRRLEIDAEVSLGDITEQLVLELERLGPYGHSNRKPLLAVRRAVIRDAKTMGKDNQHLRFVAEKDGWRMKVVCFNIGTVPDVEGMLVDLCVEPSINEWQGRRNVELICRDMLPSE
jgi:single-stranded-DNA-specific exonuclease